MDRHNEPYLSGTPSGGSAREAIIIGAGPAGLAVAASLSRYGVPSLILEKGTRIGESWHHHYDSLRLHTDKNHSELPDFGYPPSYPRYPTRDQFVEYLRAYAEHFGLQPRYAQQALRVCSGSDAWEVRTEDSLYRAHEVVIATGHSAVPHAPVWQGQENFSGQILHSADYRNGRPYSDRKVLVVGLGNSGGEIAQDLLAHGAHVALAVPSPVNVVPREVLGVPLLAFAIPLTRMPPPAADAAAAPMIAGMFGNLEKFGLGKPSEGPFVQTERRGRIPLINTGIIGDIKQGNIPVYPNLRRFSEHGVEFADGSQQDFDAVVLATGYRPSVDRLLGHRTAPVAPGGKPLPSGREADPPGLYFCGFNVTATGMLREISLEARHLACIIAARRENSQDSRAATPDIRRG